jgi:hypothetical protein
MEGEKFLDFKNEAQISPLRQKGICVDMIWLIFLYPWANTTSIDITIRTCDDGFCPLLEFIMGFQLSRIIMVAKFMKTFVDMVCGGLNVVLPNLIFNALFCKRTLIWVQGTIISSKITIGVQGDLLHIHPTPCYDGWWNNF